MTSSDKQKLVMGKLGYTLVSVEKSEPPEGTDSGRWYRYTIGRGHSTLVGNRRGTLEEVTEYAETVVENLNTRSGISGAASWSGSRKES